MNPWFFLLFFSPVALSQEFHDIIPFPTSLILFIEDIPNVAKETIDVAEQVKSRLAEDVHSYYTYELRTPNYASRLHKMSNIVSAVDKLQERRKEDSQLSKLFNIFKHEIFMSELA
ncbi:hypothetical protein OESDEN_01712 [Oesophagostomum dentatum]|uniref:NR LBD domain-containing protein n=1 Tax=Oesophagostomum dentatum TaxID=61180 RepID=A0A0B1TM24_OESDE|nr:hypothetical protein OESDEN_01712 [Oesophagostomum dentatum]